MTATIITVTSDWRDEAACQEADMNLFFGHDGDSIREALSYCRRCPVQRECLEHALMVGERYGIWGGTTEQDRRMQVRRRHVA